MLLNSPLVVAYDTRCKGATHGYEEEHSEHLKGKASDHDVGPLIQTGLILGSVCRGRNRTSSTLEDKGHEITWDELVLQRVSD